MSQRRKDALRALVIDSQKTYLLPAQIQRFVLKWSTLIQGLRDDFGMRSVGTRHPTYHFVVAQGRGFLVEVALLRDTALVSRAAGVHARMA